MPLDTKNRSRGLSMTVFLDIKLVITKALIGANAIMTFGYGFPLSVMSS